MSEMIERIARAMWEAREDIEAVDSPNRCTFEADNPEIIAMARAAIEAMREPTEAMIENNEIDHITLRCARAIHSSELPCADIWRAMINEALK